MRTFEQFEALTTDEVAIINGGGLLDGAFTGLNGLLTGAGNTLTGLSGISTGAGNALTLIGAGAGSALHSIGVGLGIFIAGLKLPTVPTLPI